MPSSNKKLGLVVSALAALAAAPTTGCSDADPVEALGAGASAVVATGTVGSPVDVPADPGIVSRRDKQGVALLGSLDPQLDAARAKLASAFWILGSHAALDAPVTTDENGLVVHADGRRLGPEELVGLAFKGSTASGATVYFYISSYFGPDAHGRARHTLQVYRSGYGTWKPLCAGDELAHAYAVPGYFGADGTYADDPAFASFGCRVSAAAKCFRWGYGPWDAGRDFLQACTRMARADYCGSGVSSTLPETPVLVYDQFGWASGFIPDDLVIPGEIVGEEPKFSFEAGWSKDPKQGAVCLSKRRWQALAPLGLCGGQLPDPRLANSGGRYCDEIGQPPGTPIPSAAEFLARVADIGGVTFNDSQVNDLGLWTWKKVSGSPARTEHLTTSQGFWDERGGTQSPSDGYVARPTWLGAVFTQQVEGTQPLHLYVHAATGDFRTTTTVALPSSWAHKELVGYIYSSAPTDGSAYGTLLRYYSAANRDYLLLRAGTPAPAGYALEGVEGYTFR